MPACQFRELTHAIEPVSRCEDIAASQRQPDDLIGHAIMQVFTPPTLSSRVLACRVSASSRI
jgi:hypothetical protein